MKIDRNLVDEVIRYLNPSNLTKGDKSYSFCCLLHKDTKPSAYMIRENGVYGCSAQCGTTSLRKFFKEYSGKTLEQVFGEKHKVNKVNYQSRKALKASTVYENILNPRKKKDTVVEESSPPVVRGNLAPISSNKSAQDYCKKRGMDQEFIDFFNITYSNLTRIDTVTGEEQNSTLFEDRIVIPIVSGGETISYEGRAVTPQEDNRFKVLYPKGTKVSTTLFNLDNLDRKAPLVLVEGIMDLPKIWSDITTNVTTTFGSNISQKQGDLLNEFEEVVIFPDGDAGGKSFVLNFQKHYKKAFRLAQVMLGMDPGDELVESKDLVYYIENSRIIRKKSEELPYPLIPKREEPVKYRKTIPDSGDK